MTHHRPRRESLLQQLIQSGEDVASSAAENLAALQGRQKILAEINGIRTDTVHYTGRMKAFFATHAKHDFSDLQAPELMALLSALSEHNLNREIRFLYEHCTNEWFRRSTYVRDIMADIYTRVGEPMKSIQLANELIERGDASSYTYTYLGKAYRQQLSSLQSAIETLSGSPSPAAATGAIHKYKRATGLTGDLSSYTLESLTAAEQPLQEQIRSAFERGFLENFAFYPGLELAYHHLRQGEFTATTRVAALVGEAALKDGAAETQNFWATAAVLQSACLTGAADVFVDRMMEALFMYDAPRSDFHAVEKKILEVALPALRKTLDSLDPLTHSHEQQQVQDAIERFERVGSTIHRLIGKPAALSGSRILDDLSQIDQALLTNSFSYRGMSLFTSEVIGGNLAHPLNGIIPDHCVTWRDKKEFGDLIAMPVGELITLVGGRVEDLPHAVAPGMALRDIADIDLAIEAIQTAVRANFKTRERLLEVIDSPEREEHFVEPTTALNHFFGVDHQQFHPQTPTLPSRTSITAAFARGLGDCRTHAQATQMFFDLWQDHQLQQHLHGAWQASGVGDTPEYERHMTDYKALLRQELRTFDVAVYAPIEMEKDAEGKDVLYHPKRTNRPDGGAVEDWRFQAANTPTAVEEHTLTMLLKRHPESGHIESARITDSFYFEPYQWKKADIPVHDIHIAEDGSLQIPAGTLSYVDGAPGNSVNVTLVPTPYAGRRRAMDISDHGKIWDHGMPYEEFYIEDMIRHRPQMEAEMSAIREWYAALGVVRPGVTQIQSVMDITLQSPSADLGR
ncbi:MAG: hypothetical protein IT567_03455 [Alphaproteobacteria bacterium]|nr:hypothetical protein [Alphaproteobacteria bacterium]